MAAVFLWIRDLVFFLICFQAVTAMVPSEKYGRYIRFFGGIVLILFVMEPAADYLNLEAPLEQAFRRIRFQNDARELSREILGMEQMRREQMFEAYEKEIEDHIAALAEEWGFRLLEAEVTFYQEEGADLGKVEEVFLLMEEGGAKEEDKAMETAGAMQVEIQPVEAVKEVEAAGQKGVTAKTCRETEKAERFRREVEAYYDLESEAVEVQFQVP